MAQDSGGGGTPGWVSDSTGFEVDIARLDDFARNMQTEMLDFQSNMAGGIASMMAANGGFANGGLAEGASYQSSETRARDQLGMLLADVGKNLLAVTNAAYAVSEEYQGADALSQASLEATRGAFTGIEGRPLLSERIAEAERLADQPGPNGMTPAQAQALADRHYGGSEVNPLETTRSGDGREVFNEGKPGEYAVPADQRDHSNDDITTLPSDDDVRQEREEQQRQMQEREERRNGTPYFMGVPLSTTGPELMA